MPADNRYLERRRQGWYAVVEVPPRLRDKVGKKRLIRSLQTRELAVARARRFAVVAELKATIHAAEQGTGGPPLLDWALIGRRTLEAYSDPEDRKAEAELLKDAARDHADKVGVEAAVEALGIALGERTPLDLYLERWLVASGYAERTKADHRHAIRQFMDWAGRGGRIASVEAVTDRTAAEFRDEVLVKGGVHPRTANKALSGLSSYWKWLEANGYAERNPWRGKSLRKPKAHRQDPEQAERAFTDAEMLTLLKGPADPTLADLMRIAALSGMRIEEICRLQVRHCADEMFRVEIAKTAAGRRSVPIHPDLKGIVARRTKDKKPTNFLFDELEATGWDGARSMAVSKRFGYYRQRLSISDKDEGRRRSRVNFHSFRRWFITQAERGGQPPWTIEAVVGHKRQGMSLGLYAGGAGPSVEQLRACVEAVRLPSPVALPA